MDPGGLSPLKGCRQKKIGGVGRVKGDTSIEHQESRNFAGRGTQIRSQIQTPEDPGFGRRRGENSKIKKKKEVMQGKKITLGIKNLDILHRSDERKQYYTTKKGKEKSLARIFYTSTTPSLGKTWSEENVDEGERTTC